MDCQLSYPLRNAVREGLSAFKVWEETHTATQPFEDSVIQGCFSRTCVQHHTPQPQKGESFALSELSVPDIFFKTHGETHWYFRRTGTKKSFMIFHSCDWQIFTAGVSLSSNSRKSHWKPQHQLQDSQLRSSSVQTKPAVGNLRLCRWKGTIHLN